MEIFSNKIIGNYTTQDYLGCGSFSSVYTAMHNFTREKVALKIAHTHDKQVIEEFNKIVKTGLKGLLKINHPDIIGIRDYFMTTDGTTDYFVMVIDLVKGDSLDRTKILDTLPLEDRLKMFVRICEAIRYAHEFEYTDQTDFHSFRVKGIFHGDIKPNNILITPDHEPRVIDFSILNLRKVADDSDHQFGNKEVNTGVFGTKGFMSPEQESTGIINEKTDIYSLGVVLKQFVYGLKYDMEHPQIPLYNALDKIIAKATMENPAERHDSVAAMKTEIESLFKKTNKKPAWLPYSIAAGVLLVIGLLLGNKFFSSNSAIDNAAISSTVSPGDANRGVKSTDPETGVELDITKNKYFALLIGNNEYQHWKKLQYPIEDVENMKKTLVEKYTFDEANITMIKNGTYEKIYKGFESFTEKGPNTYLLVYYAGHGKYDKITDKAALIPVDAEENSDSKNITSDIIKDLLKKCPIHNILFISDACYLGAMASRGENNDSTQLHDLTSFKSFASKQSRKFISSGAMETVPDKSFFNEYLIKYLNNNPHDITFEYTLYNDIIGPIQRNSVATPVFGVFFDTRDEGGHFFFVKRKN